MVDPSADARTKVYDRARATIERQIAAMPKRPPDAVIQRQYEELDAAIAIIEEEYTEPDYDEPEETPAADQEDPLASFLAEQEADGGPFGLQFPEAAFDNRDAPFARIEEVPKPESQNPAVLRYTYVEDGPITIDLAAGVEDLAVDTASEQRFSEVHMIAESFASHVAPDSSIGNQFPDLSNLAASYLAALGDSIENLSPDLLVMRGDRLRNELADQERPSGEQDSLHEVPKLPPIALTALKNLIAAHNLFTALDPLLDAKDQAMLGPDANLPLASPEEGRVLIRQAFSDGVIDKLTMDTLNEQAELSPTQPDVTSRFSRRYSGSLRNLARAIMGRAYSLAKAHWGKAAFVGGTAIASLKWIAANQEWLLDFFGGSKDMTELIKFLVHVAERLPIA